MGEHLVGGTFKSDKYDWCPAGFVALKLTDKDAQPFLWGYAETHRARDSSFTDDLQQALKNVGFSPPSLEDVDELERMDRTWPGSFFARLNSLMTSDQSLSPEALVERAVQIADICMRVVEERSRAHQAKFRALKRIARP